MGYVDEELREFLDLKVVQYNKEEFIESDPIQIPRMFEMREDIEISGFLASVIAWGQRKSIINNGKKMVKMMGGEPYKFVMGASEQDMEGLKGFVHRTFNEADFAEFVRCLRRIYTRYGGLEKAILLGAEGGDLQKGISNFKRLFFEGSKSERSFRHLSDPERGSAAKRINMFLRWMVRHDACGVDFGIWKEIKMKDLSCPLDVHSGNVARYYGLLTRKQNDAKAVRELDARLRVMDAEDPAKYDFALFGLGVFEGVK